MLAKPDCGGVSAAASFSTRVNMSKTNRLQVLKKEQQVLDDCIAAFGSVRTPAWQPIFHLLSRHTHTSGLAVNLRYDH
jgi:hypothetical protein